MAKTVLAAQAVLDLEPKCWHVHSPKISTAVHKPKNVHSCAKPEIYGKKLCWLLKLCLILSQKN